jgi:hypothetical protein
MYILPGSDFFKCSQISFLLDATVTIIGFSLEMTAESRLDSAVEKAKAAAEFLYEPPEWKK